MITQRERDELACCIARMDDDLDRNVSQIYKDQPLAQHWGRVAKTIEEIGESIAALIAFTGQNPRKGTSGTADDLNEELADVALTAMYAIQHFVKDEGRVLAIILSRARYHCDRRGL